MVHGSCFIARGPCLGAQAAVKFFKPLLWAWSNTFCCIWFCEKIEGEYMVFINFGDQDPLATLPKDAWADSCLECLLPAQTLCRPSVFEHTPKRTK